MFLLYHPPPRTLQLTELQPLAQGDGTIEQRLGTRTQVGLTPRSRVWTSEETSGDAGFGVSSQSGELRDRREDEDPRAELHWSRKRHRRGEFAPQVWSRPFCTERYGLARRFPEIRVTRSPLGDRQDWEGDETRRTRGRAPQNPLRPRRPGRLRDSAPPRGCSESSPQRAPRCPAAPHGLPALPPVIQVPASPSFGATVAHLHVPHVVTTWSADARGLSGCCVTLGESPRLSGFRLLHLLTKHLGHSDR